MYQISNLGRVKSLRRKVSKNKYSRWTTEKILKNFLVGGYFLVELYYGDNLHTRFRVHRLVAEAFIPNPENKKTVNHKDGNKLNNSVENLEWATQSENVLHAYKTGLKSEDKCSAKLTRKQVNDILDTYTGVRGEIVRLAEKYQVANSTIYRIVKNETWKYGKDSK